MRTIKKDYEASESQLLMRNALYEILNKCPIPENEILSNLGLFLRKPILSRIMFMNELYMKNLSVPGVVMEFGCRWGTNLIYFTSFRGMYEPYNHTQRCPVKITNTQAT
jgi:hypothetical protein